MDNQQILERAIQKAIDGGWDALPLGGADYWNEAPDGRRKEIVHNILYMGINVDSSSVNVYLFNHKFAKALWGEEQAFNGVPVEGVLKMVNAIDTDYDASRTVLGLKSEPRWKYFLREMVIADDPIAYLGENM
jgi:hypothetical protein